MKNKIIIFFCLVFLFSGTLSAEAYSVNDLMATINALQNEISHMKSKLSAQAVSALGSTTPAGAISGATQDSSTKILTFGSTGADVLSLQKFLVEKGFMTSKADGRYGFLTVLSVRSFQKAYGLKETGIADLSTLAKIKELSTPKIEAPVVVQDPSGTRGSVNPPPQPTGPTCTNNPYVSQWGTFGTGLNQFNSPKGIVISSLGDILVSESGGWRVQKFVSGQQTAACGPLQLGNFGGNYTLGIDSLNNYYVTNTNKVKKMSYYCSSLKQWGANPSGSGDGQFNSPMGVVVDSNNYLYVADSGNNRIQKFNNDFQGTNASVSFITKWGTAGTGDTQFSNPTGIAVDAASNVYVTDRLNNRVKKYTSTGTLISIWGWGVQNGASQFQVCTSGCQAGISGSGDGQFNQPYGITVDVVGNVYVTDYNNHRIQKFNSNGTYMYQWGGFGTGNGQFNHPTDLKVDSAGNVFVVDSGNNRIQKFGPSCPTSTYVVSCTSSSKVGDADGNGTINSIDSTIIGKIAAGVVASPTNKCCVDVDGNGIVNSNDALMSLKYFVRTPPYGNAGQLCSAVQ